VRVEGDCVGCAAVIAWAVLRCARGRCCGDCVGVDVL